MIRTVALVEGLPAQQVLERLTASVRAGEVSERATAFYLKEVKDRGLVDLWDPRGIYPFAEARFGYSPKKTGDLLRIADALPELPKLDRAFNRGKIEWTKVREITRVATPETEAAWIDFARTHTCREVEQKVAKTNKGEEPTKDGPGLPRTTFEFTLKMGAKDHQIIDTAVAKYLAEHKGAVPLHAMKAWAMRELITPCGDATAQAMAREFSPFLVVFHIDPVKGTAWMDGEGGRIELPLDEVAEVMEKARAVFATDVGDPGDCEVLLLGEPGSVPPEERDDPASRTFRFAVMARDGFRCVICGRRSHLHVHHIIARADGGRTIMEGCVTLCAHCHSRIHEHLMKLRWNEEEGLYACDMNGRPLAWSVSTAEVLEDSASSDVELAVIEKEKAEPAAAQPAASEVAPVAVAEGAPVVDGGVAHVRGEPERRVGLRDRAGHEAVAHGLRDHRGGRDRRAQVVAAHHAAVLRGGVAEPEAVDQADVGARLDGCERPRQEP